MAAAGAAQATAASWDEIVWRVLKRNEVRLVAYVPDKVLAPLINRLHADDYFTVLCPAREEEAVGIVCGADMAGMRGILLTQTSGFATLTNVLASLPVAYNLPFVSLVSERGALGDRQLVQVAVWRTLYPTLEALGMAHHTLTSIDDVEFVVEETIRQAFATSSPGAVMLSPLLTKNKA